MDDMTISDRLPDWIGLRLDAGEAAEVERAVASSPELQAEVQVLRAVAAGRGEAPAELALRISRAVREDRAVGDAQVEPAGARALRTPRAPWTLPAGARALRTPRAPWTLPRWGFAAAAVAVLAFGATLAVDGRRGGTDDALRIALDAASSPWVTDEEFVAGAPVLDGLSDEMLETLLEELGG